MEHKVKGYSKRRYARCRNKGCHSYVRVKGFECTGCLLKRMVAAKDEKELRAILARHKR